MSMQFKIIKSRFANLPDRIQRWKIIGRHPYAVPIITVAFLLVVTIGGYFLLRPSNPVNNNAFVVIISHDHTEQTVPSRQPTVGALLKKLNIRLGEGDVVEPSLETRIKQDRFRINVYRAVPVVIVDGEERSYALSASTTPRSIAERAGTLVYPEDRVKTEPITSFLNEGAAGKQVIIERATPVNVDLYGTPVVLRTHASTIGGLIKEKRLKLEKNDQIVPAPNTPIIPGQKLSLIRTGIRVLAVTEQIPMPTQNIDDPSLAYGSTAIRQKGAPGEQVVTYEISLTNNVETGRRIIQKVVNKEPVTQIAVVGSSISGIKGDMARAGIAPGDYQYVDYIVSHESGWCPTKAQGQYGKCPPYAGFVPATGGYGLCQSTPGSKMASAGADWATNPITQLRWCSGYAHSRYGSWAAAYNFWLKNHYW